MNNFNDLLTRKEVKEPLQKLFQHTRNRQLECLRTIDNKCVFLEDSIVYLQKIVGRLQQKLQDQAEAKTSEKMAELRDKQKQFIIAELQNKIKRIEETEQAAQALLMEKQSKYYDQQYKSEELRTQNAELKQQLVKKTKQIKQLIKANSTLKLMQAVNLNKPAPTLNLSELGSKKEQIQIETENYEQIESKLKEMQDCLNDEIQQYKRKNLKLQEEIEVLKVQVKRQGENSLKILELEGKIKNITSDNKQFEQSLTTQISLNNENEIKFHKKLNELKTQIHQHKKINKNITKQAQKQLRKLSSIVLGPNDKPSIFIGTATLTEQFSQLTKQILKCHKKQLNSTIFQKDATIEELKLALQSSKAKIKDLNAAVQKIKANKNERSDKSPIFNHGNSVSSKNNSKTELDTKEKENNQKIEKGEQKVIQLTNSLEDRQKQINQMRKKHDERETQLSSKILQLEAKVAENEMDLKYQQQKLQQLQKNNQQFQNNIKNEYQREAEKLKEKLKQSETQKDELRAKNRQAEQKVYGKDKILREWQKKQRQLVQKAKKIEKKYENKQAEYKAQSESKQKALFELIEKNQNLVMENKLLKQKSKLIEAKLNSLKQQNSQINQYETAIGSAKQLEAQYNIQKQLLETQIRRKDDQFEEMKQQILQREELIKVKEEKINDLMLSLNKNENQNKVLKNQNQMLRQSSQKLKEFTQKTNSFTQLKHQYQKREKLLKSEGEKIISQLKNSLKQAQIENKKLLQEKTLLKEENENLKKIFSAFEEQKTKMRAQKFKDSERQLKMTKEYENKIKILSSKVEQLEKANGNGKNSVKVSENKIKRLKGTDSLQYVQYGMVTYPIQITHIGVNTLDIFALQTQNKGQMDRILDLNEEENTNQNQQALRNSNLFMNLNENPPADDVFQICDEGEEVNFGQSSLNLHVRQLFTSLRLEIEKLFNQQEISFGITKILPQALQDDYYELMGYIKQKIAQIKVSNQISFIMAQAGNELEPALDQSLQFPQLNRHGSQNAQSLKKIVEQQQAFIHSLMNERTQQQNTINQLTLQKQQIQEQNENKFMNQCNLYKKQIKEHKKTIDVLEMNFQSMKNIIRNVLEAYSQTDDMEDDFRDSMTLYAKVGKLTEKERSRINYYIQQYLQIKGLNAGD